MLALPIALSRAIGVFAPAFSRPVWPPVQVLRTGAVLAPGQRTVTAMLRMMGRSAAPDLQTDHRVLHRAVWAPLTASRLLLRLLVAGCIPRGVVVLGLGRHQRTPPRRSEQSQRHLPRSRAVLPRAFWQSQWPALARLYGAGPSLLGRPRLGAALADGLVSRRARLGATGPPSSAFDSTGGAEEAARRALVACTRGRLGGRQPFGGSGTA